MENIPPRCNDQQNKRNKQASQSPGLDRPRDAKRPGCCLQIWGQHTTLAAKGAGRSLMGSKETQPKARSPILHREEYSRKGSSLWETANSERRFLNIFCPLQNKG